MNTYRDVRVALAEAQWAKASFSGGTGSCVAVARAAGHVGVQDTKEGSDPRTRTTLVFTEAEWTAFRAGVVAGEFD